MVYSAIILAAGKGTRYKGKKQDIIFNGKSLWENVLETTEKVIDRSHIVVVGKDIDGGNTRTESVWEGLKSIPVDTDRVIILEAARPLVTKMQILTLLEDGDASTTFVRPLVNTVVYRDGTYINRDELCELLTPQAFDYKLLYDAFSSGKFRDVTDETRIMFEYHGIKPHFIFAGENLFKVTYPGDLEVVESIYKKMNERS